MKALFNDLAKTATITSLYETLSYPASNVIDRFLDLPFVSAFQGDTITVDFGSDKQFDSIYIAGCNSPSVTILVKNNAMATVYNQAKSLPYPVVGVYPGAITGRYVSITGTAVGSNYFRIKEVGIGPAYDFGKVISGFGLPLRNGSTVTRSVTGQTMANKAPSLRSRSIVIPVLQEDGGRQKAQEMIDLLASIGPGSPIFWDVTEENQTFEQSIYAVLDGDLEPEDTGTYYRIPITLLEAR